MYKLMVGLRHLLLPPELHHFPMRIRMFRQHKRRTRCRPVLRDQTPRFVPNPASIAQRLRAHWARPPLRRLVGGAVETPPLLCATRLRRRFLLLTESTVDGLFFPELSHRRRWGRWRQVVAGENCLSGERVVVNCFHEKPTWGPIARGGAWAFAPSFSRHRDVGSENRTAAIRAKFSGFGFRVGSGL